LSVPFLVHYISACFVFCFCLFTLISFGIFMTLFRYRPFLSYSISRSFYSVFLLHCFLAELFINFLRYCRYFLSILSITFFKFFPFLSSRNFQTPQYFPFFSYDDFLSFLQVFSITFSNYLLFPPSGRVYFFFQ
jgi:hypothetical protein